MFTPTMTLAKQLIPKAGLQCACACDVDIWRFIDESHPDSLSIRINIKSTCPIIMWVSVFDALIDRNGQQIYTSICDIPKIHELLR